jgi:hypothetical protein
VSRSKNISKNKERKPILKKRDQEKRESIQNKSAEMTQQDTILITRKNYIT